jgi:hypothetical protein
VAIFEDDCGAGDVHESWIQESFIFVECLFQIFVDSIPKDSIRIKPDHKGDGEL